MFARQIVIYRGVNPFVLQKYKLVNVKNLSRNHQNEPTNKQNPAYSNLFFFTIINK